MDNTIVIAIIGVFGSALTFYQTKKHELSVQWRNEKLNHYRVLLSSLSEVAFEGTEDASRKYALAANTICLAAPQYVVEALMAYHDEVKVSNTSKSADRRDARLNDLMLAIRKDIGLAKGDDPSTFRFSLLGSPNSSRQTNSGTPACDDNGTP